MDHKNRQSGIKNTSIRNTLFVWAFAGLGIFWVSYKYNYYNSLEFWQNLVAGIHNTLFDILFIGVLIFWLNRRAETRIEIQRYLEEIDVWRNDGSSTAIKKNQISIKRLNEHGVYDINLSRSVLQGADLSEMMLPESNLSNANCYETVFQNADLRNAILDRALLTQAIFTKANLSGASLRGAMLEYADFQETNLKGADFTNANISNAVWKGAIYDNETKFPYKFDTSEMILSEGKVSMLRRYSQKIQAVFSKTGKPE